MSGLAMLELEGLDRPILWTVVIAGGAWALYAAYRGLFARSERRLSRRLFLLRTAAVAALAVVLAKPVWTSRVEQTDPGRLAVVVDDSVSMSLMHEGGLSRYALARQAAERLRAAVEEVPYGPRVRVDLFDIRGEPVADGLPDEPRTERTDLIEAVGRAAARLRAKPLVGVVVLSDGADNAERMTANVAQRCPVPVYALGFPESGRGTDVDWAVARVRGPDWVIVHNTAKIDVHVSKKGAPAGEARVRILRGGETLAEDTVALGEGDTECGVSLGFTPSEPGTFVYGVDVRGAAEERMLANNRRSFALRVEEEPIRIFYLEGFLRYEYRFLKSRLDEDPDVSMVSLIRRTHPDRDWTASEGSFLTPERLENFDIVVLGDMEGNYLAGPEYDALREWVDAGHALLVLGGYRSFGPSGWRATPLAEILPVVFRSDGPTQSEEPFVVELTAKGRAHPMFEITGDRVKDAALWQSAPPLLGSSLVEGVKPGADVLAVNPNAGGEDAPVPVAVVQRYGAGHTVVLAVDTTWRWSRFTRILGRSDALFARFWSQTVRWLAGRDQRSAAVPLTVTTDRPWYELGDTVTLRAAGGAPADADRSGVAISAEITEPDGRTVPVALRAAGVAALSGVFRPASGGRYEAVAVMTVEDGPAIAERTEFMVYSAGVELADVRSHPDRLRSIAAATGGEYVDIGEAAGMADRIPRRERTNRYTRRREIWNSPVLFLFFLAAVTAEWVLRRRNHLV